MESKKKILITGGGGNLAQKLQETLVKEYAVILADISFRDEVVKNSSQCKHVIANLTVYDDSWAKEFDGVFAVYHFAAQNPYPEATWEDSKKSVDITANVFLAASKYKVSRVIFASSNHVMGGYRTKGLKPGELTTSSPIEGFSNFNLSDVKMDASGYASAKLFGERLAKCMVDAGQIPCVIVIRIGWCQPGENNPKSMSAAGTTSIADPGITNNVEELKEKERILEWFRLMWLSNRDFLHLFGSCCLKKDLTGFLMVNGMSKNTGQVWDIEHTKKVLGYEPQDDVVQHL
eukprot:TRINITY_DN8155_c0_g1_i4.p1 TRINITY_DN8155_c0_g1~~TRINITY_DN8155_c0_g1_i4.p1  ORF type:complete len:290 (-),score=56.73 TRINITY_DN8155_c0_g1_i4:145-1014(-)